MILQPREFLAGAKGRFIVENLTKVEYRARFMDLADGSFTHFIEMAVVTNSLRNAERQARHFYPDAIIRKRKKDR